MKNKTKRFADAVEKMKHKPNSSTVRAIDSRDFSLSINSVFAYKPEVLALKEYQRCLELLENRIPQAYNNTTARAVMNLQSINASVYNNVAVKESKHRKDLEAIAVEVVRDLFSIPEHINILPSLSPEPGQVDEQDDSEVKDITEERKAEINIEINKRIILNGLVHGCAMHIWKSAHYIVKDKVDELDPSLMDMYNILTASISWMLWQISPEMAIGSIEREGITQGKNEVKFEDDEVNIECEGYNFPILLQEVTKGAMDYLICHGIPEDFTEEELIYYYSMADNYSCEFWHYLLSPTLWTSLIEAADVDSQELPKIVMNLSRLKYVDLSLVINSCVDGPEEGRKKLKEFKIL